MHPVKFATSLRRSEATRRQASRVVQSALLGLCAAGSGCSVDNRSPGIDEAPLKPGAVQPSQSGSAGDSGTSPAAAAETNERLPTSGGLSPVGDVSAGNGDDAGPSCPGCLIAGECTPRQATEPGNVCHVCDPDRDASSWSNVSGECDDGAFCTVNDTCQDGRCTGGGDYPCDDGIACNGISSCDEQNDRCTTAENQCPAEQLCNTASGECVRDCSDCQIDGVCVAAGAVQAGNPCRVCDPARSAVGFSANPTASCGAGPSACSAQDTCNDQGQCVANDLADGTACGAEGSGQACIAGLCSSCASAASPDAFCAQRSPATPLCDRARGQCAACLPTTCSGAAPVCDAALGCRACREHADCPSSACHLSGPSQGSCFTAGQVVQVATVDALRTQIGILVPQAPRVLRLAASTFTFTDLLTIGSDATELAILGQAGTLVTGGPNTGAPLWSLSSGAALYVANVTFANGPFDALSVTSGGTLWLDDSVIRDYGNSGLSGAGEGHVRRSRIRGATRGIFWQAGTLFLENSSLGPSPLGIQITGSPIIELRYVTVAGNTTSMSCDASPGPSGFVRNSILTATTDPSIAGNACDLLTFSGNALDQAGFGTQIGHFDTTWFRDAANGDFHLTGRGAQTMGNGASLAGDDPERDVDGAVRPARGAPGIDQP
jgi:hypothetical protein